MKKFLSIILAIISIFSCFSIIAGAEETTEREFENGDIISFGLYPQSKVDDIELIKELNKEVANLGYSSGDYTKFKKWHDWYVLDVEHNGEWYRGCFNNDIFTTIWYRFELLDWIILDVDSGYVLSMYAIDSLASEYAKFSDSNEKNRYDSNSRFIWNSIRCKDCVIEKEYLNSSYWITTYDGVELNRSKPAQVKERREFSTLTFDELFMYNKYFEEYSNLINDTNDYIPQKNAIKKGCFIYNYPSSNYIREKNGEYKNVPNIVYNGFSFISYTWGLEYYNTDYSNIKYQNGKFNLISDRSYDGVAGFRPTCTINLTSNEIICSHSRKENVKEEIVEDSTCTKVGTKKVTYKCLACGYEEVTEESIDKKEHNTRKTTISPTCSQDGYDEYKCYDCGYSYKDNYTYSTGHAFKYVVTKEPTCADYGVSTYTCKNCNLTYKDIYGCNMTKTIGLTEHQFECIETVEANHFILDYSGLINTSGGYRKYKCTVCGAEKQESYQDDIHSALPGCCQGELIESKASTCIEEGYNVYRCICGYECKTVTPISSHKYKIINVDSNGTISCKCDVCSKEITECIHKNMSHSYITEISSYGVFNGWAYVCKDCNKRWTESEYYNEFNSNCSHKNTASNDCFDICLDCCKVLREEHTYTYTTIGATCVTAGYREGKCSCGKTIIDGNVPATGIHTYELTTTTSSTYYNTGKRIYTCKDCNKIKEETIDMLSCFVGDVDNDNAITVADARLSLRAAIKLDSPEQTSREYRACDYDGDNNITVNDARSILRKAVGLE